MVEQQVKAECFAADIDRVLLAKERETGAKLDQELSDVRNQSPLELLFCSVVCDSEKLETVRILQRFPC